jgi:hypothetical protein
MKISDSILALLLAAGLMGIAAVAVFAIQHGFETGIAWFVFLFPGIRVAAPVSDGLKIANSAAENLIFRGLLFIISFGWYFGICFVAVKMYRFTRAFVRPRVGEK